MTTFDEALRAFTKAAADEAQLCGRLLTQRGPITNGQVEHFRNVVTIRLQAQRTYIEITRNGGALYIVADPSKVGS